MMDAKRKAQDATEAIQDLLDWYGDKLALDALDAATEARAALWRLKQALSAEKETPTRSSTAALHHGGLYAWGRQ